MTKVGMGMKMMPAMGMKIVPAMGMKMMPAMGMENEGDDGDGNEEYDDGMVEVAMAWVKTKCG